MGIDGMISLLAAFFGFTDCQSALAEQSEFQARGKIEPVACKAVAGIEVMDPPRV